MTASPTKRIGINTVFLTVRKIITLAIAFYSTRLLLRYLGEADFGLYGLIGSIVIMFAALRSMFSTSIQRYINAAKVDNDTGRISEIFSLGMRIHIWIALLFVIVVETGGLILLPTLNIPPDSHTSAFWVLQFTIFATVATILTVPYDAIIIANERFRTYAVISVIESVMKLAIIWMLGFSDHDRVIVYSALFLGVALIIRAINSIYCHRTFGEEVRYRKVRNPELLREMTTFAGWQFCGNMGYSLANYGINLILNHFGGLLVNTARAISYQLMGAATQFVVDMNLSFQPRSIIAYTRKDLDEFKRLILINSKASFIMGLLLAVPIYLCAPGILRLWLGELPPHTLTFTRWILVYMVIRSLHGPIDLMFKAKAKLKSYQITELIIMTLNLPISGVLLLAGCPVWSAFAVMCGLEIIDLMIVVRMAFRETGLPCSDYIRSVALRALALLAVLGLTGSLFAPTLDSTFGFFPLALAVAVIIGVTALLSLLIMFTPYERRALLKMLRFKL